MNTWQLDITYGEEIHVVQGHLDPIFDLMNNSAAHSDKKPLAAVEIQALVSGPFANSRVVSTVRLHCYQDSETIQLAQGLAVEKAMEGLHEGWMTLRERVEKGAFPGAAT